MEKTYRFVKLVERLPVSIGSYIVRYKNGNVEETGFYPLPKLCFYHGTDNVNNLVEEWLEEIPKDERQKEEPEAARHHQSPVTETDRDIADLIVYTVTECNANGDSYTVTKDKVAELFKRWHNELSHLEHPSSLKGDAVRVKLLESTIEDLIMAIPKQSNDYDWWPDSLTEAVNMAQSLLIRQDDI